MPIELKVSKYRELKKSAWGPWHYEVAPAIKTDFYQERGSVAINEMLRYHIDDCGSGPGECFERLRQAGFSEGVPALVPSTFNHKRNLPIGCFSVDGLVVQIAQLETDELAELYALFAREETAKS